MKRINHKITFCEFLVIWNQSQGLSTPHLHRRMADWLDQGWREGERKMLLMAFRAAGKSTVIGVFILWVIWQNPDIRILILSAEQELANRMVRSLRRMIERHPLTIALKPSRPQEWAADRFTVKRDKAGRESTLLARGLASNLTGSRADLVILDDVEVPNNCETTAKRHDLRGRLSEVDYILMQDGLQLYIGTPHSYYSIYAHEARKEIGEEYPFLKDFKRLYLPIIDEKGRSLWPERFDDEAIKTLRQRHGPAKFSSQMLLKPQNLQNIRLDAGRLISYDDELSYHEGNLEASLWLGETKLVSASCMWDPAYGDPDTALAKNGDQSTIAVVYCDDLGRYYIHRVEVIKVDSNNQLDPARQQCQQVAKFLDAHYIPSVLVEGNGIGRFLPRLLRSVMEEMKIQADIITVMNKQSKVRRILDAFDAPLAANQIYAHKSVLAGTLTEQMSEWRADGRMRGSAHDDSIDAVAGAILAEPVRLPRHFFNRKQNANASRKSWRASSKTHAVKNNFNPYAV